MPVRGGESVTNRITWSVISLLITEKQSDFSDFLVGTKSAGADILPTSAQERYSLSFKTEQYSSVCLRFRV